MAESVVAICNGALNRIGADSINTLTEDNPRARLMNLIFAPTRDRLLRAHNWNFAQFRADLQEVPTNPLWGYAHQFQLPQDPLCLMVLETNLDPNAEWRIEHWQNVTASESYRVIVTDEASVSILYVGRLTDVTQWDALFSYLVETDLAFQAAYKLTRNAQVMAQMKQELTEARLTAKARDGQEGRALKRWQSDVLTRIR